MTEISWQIVCLFQAIFIIWGGFAFLVKNDQIRELKKDLFVARDKLDIAGDERFQLKMENAGLQTSEKLANEKREKERKEILARLTEVMEVVKKMK